MRPRRALQIAVAGGSAPRAATMRLARAVGRGVAKAGATLVCGGLGGVMEAAARGAAEVGGTVVGILPGYAHADGNPWLSIAIPTGFGHGRNVLVAAAGDALIALDGAHGTLAEVALARVLGRPVVGVGAWADVPGVIVAPNATQAVTAAIRLARQAGSARRARARSA